MIFRSTGGADVAPSISHALHRGLADDGGLYIPEPIPTLDLARYNGVTDSAEIAAITLAPYFSGDPLEDSLDAICRHAFEWPPAIRDLRPELRILELFHGPTAAFKDYGARFLSACVDRLTGNDRPRIVLVATSGDTGAAVGAAFGEFADVHTLILYPEKGVSPRQAHQLGAFGSNVTAVAVDGQFDDCQRLVKRAFGDRTLNRRVDLISANSISVGRLLPQIGYFAQAALNGMRETGAPVNLVVPTGNLGNGLAAVLARQMGLPIGDIVLSTNANRTLSDFQETGRFEPRPSVATLANAMDVGNPSNYVRLAYLTDNAPDARTRVEFTRIDDSEIERSIKLCWERFDHAICPHTATAFAACTQRSDQPWTIAATAHPAKFEQIVEPIIETPVPIPDTLARILAARSECRKMAVDYEQLKVLLERVRAR